MSSRIPSFETRLEALKLVHSALIDLSPVHARKLRVLIDNPGPPEHFQKLALEILSEAMEVPVDLASMLMTAQRAIANPNEYLEELTIKVKGLSGL